MPKLRLILLFLIAFLVGADEFLLGPILTPVAKDLGVTPERVVLFIAAYSLPLAILAPVFGLLSDRWGRLAILAPASFVFGIASIATALVQSYELGLLTRLITGAASAGMLPIAFALAGDQGEAQGARAIAFVTSGLTLGIILSPGIGALVTQHISWRAAFAGLGALALPISIYAALSRGRTASRVDMHAPAGPVLVQGAIGALVAMGLGLGGAIGIFALVGERLRDLFGLGTGMVGLIYASFGVLTFAGNVLMPRVLARVGSGRRVMRIALCCILAIIIVIYAMATLPIMPVLLALLAWAVLGGIGAPALQAHIAGLSTSRRGTLMALGMSMMNLGVAASTGLAGIAYSHGAVWVALLGSVMLGASIIALRSQPIVQKHGAV